VAPINKKRQDDLARLRDDFAGVVDTAEGAILIYIDGDGAVKLNVAGDIGTMDCLALFEISKAQIINEYMDL